MIQSAFLEQTPYFTVLSRSQKNDSTNIYPIIVQILPPDNSENKSRVHSQQAQ